MYENPLLPNVKLKQMYALMQRIRTMSLKEPGLRGLEAVLAASLMHMDAGDFVSMFPGLAGGALLAAERTSSSKKTNPAPLLPKGQRLALSTGIAQGLQLAGQTRLALCFLHAGEIEQGWREVLEYATRSHLPLLLVCVENLASKPRKAPPTAVAHDAFKNASTQFALPVFSVDGADAVAVYRVMQESVLRARTLGGVALLSCWMPGAATTGTQDPLLHMRGYLAERKLLPRKSKAASPGNRNPVARGHLH